MGVPFRSQLAGLCTLAVSLTAHAEAPAPSAAEPLLDATKPALPALPKLPPVPKKPTLADVPSSSLPARPELPMLPQLPSSHDLTSAGEVALAALPDEIKPLIPDPDKLAEWFQGHGGAILGTGTMVLAPLGYVAGGGKNAFYRSHLPGLGLHGQIGLLFLRRYGIVAHGGYAEHLKGSDAAKAGTSWQMGLGALFLLRPEEKTPYLELGINRNSFSNDVNVLGGSATRKAAAWDGRVGLGYMVLTKSQKFLYTPRTTSAQPRRKITIRPIPTTAARATIGTATRSRTLQTSARRLPKTGSVRIRKTVVQRPTAIKTASRTARTPVRCCARTAWATNQRTVARTATATAMAYSTPTIAARTKRRRTTGSKTRTAAPTRRRASR